jgi:hypothetical protein
MTRLAKLISQEEGFGRANCTPTTRHNPGDLRHSPHSEHPGGAAHANDVGTIDTDAHGWEDLERQLLIYAHEGLTLRAMVALYAPPSDHNDTGGYLKFVCSGLGLGPETLVSEALKVTV